MPKTGFTDPHDKIASKIDSIKGKKIEEHEENEFISKPLQLSPEYKRAVSNMRWIDRFIKKPIVKGAHAVQVFGCETVDPRTQVYGDNIWNRSIYTVDELCDIFDSATYEQQGKYITKKRKVGGNLKALLILLGVGGGATIFMILMFMSGFGG